MARMYPDRIPQAVRDDPGHQAECDVYEALRDRLGADWSAYGWAGWVLKRWHDGALNGEADFILAHAEHGVFVIEVNNPCSMWARAQLVVIGDEPLLARFREARDGDTA